MKTSIYVITQSKIFDLPQGYLWIQSGAALQNKISGIIHDCDSEDNRSEKNPFYSEFSAHYYIWKNDNESDYIGICHYRRFIDNGDFAIKPMTTEKINKILAKADIILPYHECIGPIKDQFVRYHGEEDWIILLDTLKEYDYEFYLYYSQFVKRTELSMRNIFIARREVAHKYWGWIFGLLDKLERRVDLLNRNPYEMRILGYLVERIEEAWFIYNKYSRVYRYCFNTDNSNWGIRVRKSIHQVVRNMKQEKEN